MGHWVKGTGIGDDDEVGLQLSRLFCESEEFVIRKPHQPMDTWKWHLSKKWLM